MASPFKYLTTTIRHIFLLPFLLLTTAAAPSHAEETLDLTPIRKWISLQKDIRSVEADFVQTRALRALKSPLSSPGKLWLNSSGDIRWEIGSPPKTILLRKKGSCLLIHPSKKTYHNTAQGPDAPMGPQSFPMMELPIASSFADFTKRFEVLSIKFEAESCQIELLPKEPQARKFLQKIRIGFTPETGHPQFFEILTKDGASLKNEFSNIRVNQKLDRSIFDFDLNGYQSEPAP